MQNNAQSLTDKFKGKKVIISHDTDELNHCNGRGICDRFEGVGNTYDLILTNEEHYGIVIESITESVIKGPTGGDILGTRTFTFSEK